MLSSERVSIEQMSETGTNMTDASEALCGPNMTDASEALCGLHKATPAIVLLDVCEKSATVISGSRTVL